MIFRAGMKVPAITLFFMTASVTAQVGGSFVYPFLDIPSSARSMAMGGKLISIGDGDAALVTENPSLHTPSMNKTAVLSYMSYFAGINSGLASYTFHNSLGSFTAGLKYFDYGTFREADEANIELGSFRAGDIAFIGSYGREIDSSFSVGGSIKAIYSNMYLLTSVGLAADLAAAYRIRPIDFLATAVISNAGIQLKPYQPGREENLPFDISFGLSKGFRNMPFLFSLVAHQLGRGKLTYPEAESQASSFAGSESDKENSSFENLIRHLIFSAELFPKKNFNLRFGYNFQRRKEMQYVELPGTVGLSWGFALKISRFRFSYSRSAYHLAGSPNYITVQTSFSDWAAK